MATLTENVARVTSALADIEQAIIDKGVTPSGKCETFADAIAQISGGGDAKVDIGTFTTSTGGSPITCGFKPKWVVVSSAFNGTTSGAFSNTETEIWNDDGGYFEYYTAASATNGIRTTNRISANDNGFTHMARYNNKTAYYIAIG